MNFQERTFQAEKYLNYACVSKKDAAGERSGILLKGILEEDLPTWAVRKLLSA